MTSRVVTYSQLECDSCGVLRDSIDKDATAARISGNRDGWKYAAFEVKGLQKYAREPGVKSETVPRVWDCCPDCPLPESATEAAEIRSRRKVQTSRGKWIDREAAS